MNKWEWGLEFCGIKMSSNYYTFHIFSDILENNKVNRIIELGTHTGSMSIALALLAFQRDIPFETYDIRDQKNKSTDKILSSLGARSNVVDIFKEIDRFKAEVAKEPIYLLCDNGNKKHEFSELVPRLFSGSVISVHDYGTEFTEAMIADEIREQLIPYKQEQWTKYDVRLATWIKK